MSDDEWNEPDIEWTEHRDEWGNLTAITYDDVASVVPVSWPLLVDLIRRANPGIPVVPAAALGGDPDARE